ncbi:MAG: tRNA (guanine-N7)-methyltransferase [Polyangiaceae bacterium]
MSGPRVSYAHAARLPDGTEPVPIASLHPGGWSGPVEIEIGPGRGGFLFERAASAPDALILGFEIRRKWAHIVNERLVKAGLHPRVQCLAENALVALPRLRGSARAVFLHFPDPWWKKRHEKRLVMGDVLLDEVARLLPPGGELFVQTDVEERATQYREQIASHTAFAPRGDLEGSPTLAENPYAARSHREHRAIADGLPIHRMRFVRRGGDAP